MKANTYPIFEADQILTSGHLNDLVVYLEEQERLTRNKLIGIGIVCGLQVIYSQSGSRKQITISKGCGITSEGYLVTMDDTICTHIREDAYIDPVDYPDLAGMKLTEMLTQQEASLEENEDVAPISSISQNTLNEKAVLLYLEKLDEDLKNCIPEDCNDKGKKRIFTIRKLLVNKTDLRELISEKQGYKTPQTETTLENAVNGVFHLPEVYTQRVVVPAVPGIQLSTLLGVYANSINGSIPQLAAAISKSTHLLLPALDDLWDENLTEAKITTALQNRFETLKKNNPTALQYFYDFLNDLADAYSEFRDEAFDLLSLCCPDENLFAFHLMLGEVVPTDDCAPSIYRHRFYPSPIHDTPNHLTQKVRCLYERLLIMLQSFEVPEVDQIEITPGKSAMYTLAERAIPYYYQVNGKTNLYRHWDYDKKRKCRAAANFSYHSEKYANPGKKSPFAATQTPLNFNLAKSDFFRIEGHLGKNYQSSIQAIQQQRDQYGLPFDIVALKLGRVPDEPVLDQQCFFQDLDTQYAALRQEMLCFLTKESNYFANIEYQPKTARQPAGNTTGPSGSISASHSTPVFNFTNYSRSTARYYQPTGSSDSSGNVLKKSSTGQSREGTIGNIVMTQFITAGQPTYNIQNLLNTFISRYSGFANLAVGSLILRIQYPLQMLQLIEDAVVAIPDQLNELVFDDFEETYQKLIDKAGEFKDKIEENLQDPDFQKVGNEEDISDHLDRFVFDCNLSRFKVLFEEYQKRIKKIMQQSLLSEYVKSHPGLEHTGGVPKGGTFVLVYHDETFAIRPSLTRPNLAAGNMLTNTGRTSILNKSNSPSSLPSSLYMMATGGFTTTETASFSRGFANAASGISSNINTGSREINHEDFVLANDLPLEISRLANKVVVGDFSLPYICCSDCPPVTYVFPSVEATLTLSKNVFCKPDRDQATYPFITSPEGGEVKGPGVSKDENGRYIFNPSAGEVQPGAVNFTYEVDGRTVSLSVEVVAAPVAAFELSLDNVVKTPNGVHLSIKNDSENADSFLWEVNGQSSTDKDLVRFFVNNPGNELTVKLTATNKACFDSLTQTLSIAAEPLVFAIENGQTTFCADNKESIGLVTKPEGGKVTASTSDFKVTRSGDKYSFVPAVNPPGLHELSYTDKDGRTAKLQLIISSPNAEFTINPTDADGMLVFMEFIPVDRTGDVYTWSDGRTELVKTNKLPNPGPKVSVDFSNQNRKTFTLRVDQGQCNGTFSITTDIKTLLAQLDNQRGDNGRIPGGGNVITVGRGSNSVIITNLGRNSVAVTKLLTSELGMDSVSARKALSALPLTINGISNASLKIIQAEFTKLKVGFTVK